MRHPNETLQVHLWLSKLGGDISISWGITQGLLNRWTSQYDWGITTGGLTFNLNNGTKTHLIIVKLLENTFLGMTKVRAWPILTLAML